MKRRHVKIHRKIISRQCNLITSQNKEVARQCRRLATCRLAKDTSKEGETVAEVRAFMEDADDRAVMSAFDNLISEISKYDSDSSF